MQSCNAAFEHQDKVDAYFLNDTGIYPNSPLPVLHYKQALHLPILFQGITVKKMLRQNGWTNNWKAGIYTYHHYHSNTHEVMVVIDGKTVLLLGGENGTIITVKKGDVIVIPAGVAHKNLGKEESVTCIGGYPDGKDYDMNYGHKDERPGTDRNISFVPLPGEGPVCGESDPLLTLWKVVRNIPLTPVQEKVYNKTNDAL